MRWSIIMADMDLPPWEYSCQWQNIDNGKKDELLCPYGENANIHTCIRITRSTMAPRSVHIGVRSRKLSNVGQSLDGWPKMYYLELLRASEGTLSRWSRQHLILQWLAQTNPHWARVVFSLCVIHKEGLCLSSRDINRLMMYKYNAPRI
jgi:hypothetical protein